MKHSSLFYGICLLVFFNACKPDFDLNAPYKNVTIVYGILNYQDSIHYVKIYKGFQLKEGDLLIDVAQNPDSIYYYDKIDVVLQEFKNNKRTSRPEIKLFITNDFPRNEGFFYYDQEKIIYYTAETIYKGMEYKIVITNKDNGHVIEGKTSIVEDDNFIINQQSSYFPMTGLNCLITFTLAKFAIDYEFQVNFLYYEVDKKTNLLVKTGKIEKKISSRVGEDFQYNKNTGNYEKKFPATFYDDISKQLSVNNDVVRYIGTPEPLDNGRCIEIYGWAAGEGLVNYLLSNQPTNSFVSINNIYTNLEAKDGCAFGFLSSKVKISRTLATLPSSEDSLYYGSKTRHLGFRPWADSPFNSR